MRIILPSLVASALLFGAAAEASACSCTERTPREEARASAAVVEVEIGEVVAMAAPDPHGTQVLRGTITRAFKGPVRVGEDIELRFHHCDSQAFTGTARGRRIIFHLNLAGSEWRTHFCQRRYENENPPMFLRIWERRHRRQARRAARRD